MPPLPPLTGGGIGWNFFTGILVYGVFAPVLSFLGVIATTYALWRADEDGLRLRPWMVILFPLIPVLVWVTSVAAVFGSIPRGLGSDPVLNAWIVTALLPIGMGVVVGSGLYRRQWVYVGVGLGAILAALVTFGHVRPGPSPGSVVLLGLLPVISVGVGYLSSGDRTQARERALPESSNGINL